LVSALFAGRVTFTIIKNDGIKENPCIRAVFLVSAGGSIVLALWKCLAVEVAQRNSDQQNYRQVYGRIMPKYYLLTTTLSYLSLMSFLSVHPFKSWKGATFLMGSLLAVSMDLNIVNLTCFNVNEIKYLDIMSKIEKGAGNDQTTVGKLLQESKVENNQEYTNACKAHSRFSCYSKATGFLSLAASFAQLYLYSTQNFNLFSY
jgi:hypothetical protein